VFARRRLHLVVDEPPAPEQESPPDALAELATRFGLRPYGEVDAAALTTAIALADPLWAAPRAGEMQAGVAAFFAGFPPAGLVGSRVWPIPVRSASGPALVLADVRHRVHAVVDVALSPAGRAPRPPWVAAAAISYGARMAGSADLWRHWAIELTDHAPHEWTPGCEGHHDLPRPNAQGLLVTAIPQHDAWVMSRSWLPSEFVVPSVTDVRWIALSPAERSVKEREAAIRSRWDSVSFAAFGTALAARYDDALPDPVATILRMLLPPDER
jgi:hypothetical protein